MYQDNPVGVELFSYVKTFFCCNSIDAGHVSENALYTHGSHPVGTRLLSYWSHGSHACGTK